MSTGSAAVRTPSPPLEVAVLRSWDSIEALAPAWRDLLAGTPPDAIFLTPEWIGAWRDAMQPLKLEPCIVQVTCEGRLVGIAPFYYGQQYLLDTVPYRILRFMGDYASGSVYSDIVADPALAEPVYAAVFEVLLQERCDGVWLPQVADWTGATERVRRALRQTAWYFGEKPAQFFALELPESFAAYEKQLSSATRKDFRRATKKMFAAGGTIETVAAADELSAALDDLFRLNTQRWRAADLKGVFERKPLEAEFYRQFTPVALRRDWLRLSCLRLQGETIACEYGYMYKQKYFAIQGGFDVARFPGAGKVLLSQTVKRVIEEGASLLDFVTGDAAYKSRYKAVERSGAEFFLLKRNLKTAALRLGNVWPRGRFFDFTAPRRSP